MTGVEPAAPLKVLVVVPWYGGSHRAWVDGWRAASVHDIAVVTAEPRMWRHRMLAGTVELAEGVKAAVAAHGRPDVLMVSSLTDTAALLGLARRAIGDAPVVQFQHESQLLHPNHSPADNHLIDIEWRSLCAADQVWFNSEFHRLSYLDSASRDVSQLAYKSLVMPVGVDLSEIGTTRRKADGGITRLLFNQRWDADKRPERVVAAMASAAAAGARFEVVLAGEQPPDDTSQLRRCVERLGKRVVHAGTAQRESYIELIHSCDAVVGDPAHEFFGISAVEAMAAGCFPLLPDDLSYPELVGDYAALLHRSHDLVARLIDYCRSPSLAPPELAAAVRRFDWSVVGAHYDVAVAGLAP